MPIAGQHVRIISLGGRVNDGVSGGQPVTNAKVSRREGNLGVQADDLAGVVEGDHGLRGVLAQTPGQPFREFQLNNCRNQPPIASRQFQLDLFAQGGFDQVFDPGGGIDDPHQ